MGVVSNKTKNLMTKRAFGADNNMDCMQRDQLSCDKLFRPDLVVWLQQTTAGSMPTAKGTWLYVILLRTETTDTNNVVGYHCVRLVTNASHFVTREFKRQGYEVRADIVGLHGHAQLSDLPGIDV